MICPNCEALKRALEESQANRQELREALIEQLELYGARWACGDSRDGWLAMGPYGGAAFRALGWPDPCPPSKAK